MIHAVLTLAVLAGLSSLMVLGSVEAAPLQEKAGDDKPVVVLETSMGEITLELDRAKAPITVDNFLKYVDKGYYEGVAFHRVIKGFMIQTGGLTETNNVLKDKKEGQLPPIKNESQISRLSNLRGTISMARTSDPDSATSQFFINHVDNKTLDNYGGGYAVFGKVIAGMDVVDKIASVQTTSKRDANGNPHSDVPAETVLLKKATRKGK